MKKLKTFTAVITIGNGTTETGLFKTVVELEAFSQKIARKKALQIALSANDVTVELSAGKLKGTNPIYVETFGGQPEAW